jgi:hypothetical protein
MSKKIIDKLSFEVNDFMSRFGIEEIQMGSKSIIRGKIKSKYQKNNGVKRLPNRKC